MVEKSKVANVRIPYPTMSVLRNGDASFAQQTVNVITASLARHFRDDETLMFFGGSYNHKTPCTSKIVSDLDIAAFMTQPSLQRLNPYSLKKFFTAIQDATKELAEEHDIYAVTTFDPNLGAALKYLAKYHMESKTYLKIEDDKIVLLDCMFYPSLSSAISWPNPILGGMEVFGDNVMRMLSDDTELLVFGKNEERQKLKRTIELAKPLRDRKANLDSMNHIICISEKQIADTYGNFITNVHLPEEMLAVDTMNQMKNVTINLVKHMKDSRENWFWKKIVDRQDELPDYTQKFVKNLNTMRNGNMPTRKELVRLLDSSVEMINNLVANTS